MPFGYLATTKSYQYTRFMALLRSLLLFLLIGFGIFLRIESINRWNPHVLGDRAAVATHHNVHANTVRAPHQWRSFASMSSRRPFGLTLVAPISPFTLLDQTERPDLISRLNSLLPRVLRAIPSKPRATHDNKLLDKVESPLVALDFDRASDFCLHKLDFRSWLDQSLSLRLCSLQI
jgi:hypothetical protein